MLVQVIPNLTTFWLADYNRSEVLSFTPEHKLSSYTTEAFMRLVIANCGTHGEKQFQLSDDVMEFFFKRDLFHSHRLISKGRYETGDSQTAATIWRYIDSESNAIWEEERCQGNGRHGLSGRFYIYEFQGYTFRSNMNLNIPGHPVRKYETYYLDKNGNFTSPEKAYRTVHRELDEDGSLLKEMFSFPDRNSRS